MISNIVSYSQVLFLNVCKSVAYFCFSLYLENAVSLVRNILRFLILFCMASIWSVLLYGLIYIDFYTLLLFES